MLQISRSTDDLRIDTFHFLSRCSALLIKHKNWLAQCQDNVTEWAIKPGPPVGLYYKVHCHKSVHVLIRPYTLPGCKTPSSICLVPLHPSVTPLLICPYALGVLRESTSGQCDASIRCTERGRRIGRARASRVKMVGSNPHRVKVITYKIETCCFLVRCSAL